ncbi:MAG: PaREP1 family protein, partial [Nitrososphaerales archaeon]
MGRYKKSFIRVTTLESSEMQKRYQRLHSKYLTNADRLLSEGDLSQAAEKYWGAVATVIKNIDAK